MPPNRNHLYSIDKDSGILRFLNSKLEPYMDTEYETPFLEYEMKVVAASRKRNHIDEEIENASLQRILDDIEQKNINPYSEDGYKELLNICSKFPKRNVDVNTENPSSQASTSSGTCNFKRHCGRTIVPLNVTKNQTRFMMECAYFNFAREIHEKMLSENPNLTHMELFANTDSKWAAMLLDEKVPYIRMKSKHS